MACVEAAEFKLAAVAGLNIIMHPDHLEELAQYYEEFGYQNEMISLLETGMGLDRAHVGIFTELGVLLAKYRPERLMEHCKQYTSVNITLLYLSYFKIIYNKTENEYLQIVESV